MGSIAERLKAAQGAAVASSGIPGATAAPAAQPTSLGKPNDEAQKAAVRPVNRSVSALKAADIIPRKTKESQILFKTLKPNLNAVISGQGREPKRIHFVNRYLLTEDAEVIEYVRKNAKAFAVSEVADKPAQK